MLRSLLLYPATGLVLLTVLVLLIRGRIAPLLGWTVAGVGVAAFLLLTCWEPRPLTDGRTFAAVGETVWRGADPYANRGMLNPPTALPLFAVLAAVPAGVRMSAWTVLNLVGCLVLVEAARRVLRVQEGESGWRLTPAASGVLTAAVVLSMACRYGLELGQLSVTVTLLLFGALYLQGRNRPIAAGVCLALASVKTATMLPFLLLFHRKEDRPAWVSMAVAGLGLCLLATHPADLLGRCRECLANIGHQGAPGQMNDYTYANVSSPEIFGFDQAFYRVGLRDRTAVHLAQFAVLALVGAWIGWRLWRRGLSRGAGSALVACYSVLFLYHRLYDMVMLTLPLVYCVGRAEVERGRPRVWYVLSAAALLSVLHLRVGLLRDLTRAALEHPGAGSNLLQAVVLPYGTWLILAAMFCLAAGERSRQRQEAARPDSPPPGGAARPDPLPALVAD